jgi:predicted transposase YbfD/YdcC
MMISRNPIWTPAITALMVGSLSCGVIFAQSPRGEAAVNLSVNCKAMVDAKAREMTATVLPTTKYEYYRKVLRTSHKSKYDAENKRCYMDLFIHEVTGFGKEKKETESRTLWDVQMDEQLAYANIEEGWKIGMVFDPKHEMTSDESRTRDDANAYIDEMMSDTPR